MITKKIFIIFIFISQLLLNNSYSVEPDEILQNPKQELRARNISKYIRCMVCQNQSIDESDAPLAKDLRILIRNQIKDGKNDEEIYKFLTKYFLQGLMPLFVVEIYPHFYLLQTFHFPEYNQSSLP